MDSFITFIPILILAFIGITYTLGHNEYLKQNKKNNRE
jgi:hypothetical protein